MPAPPRATKITPLHVFAGACWAALLVTGGVLQTHLRFYQRDLEIQARIIQEELAVLQDERRTLAAQVERLRGGEQLRERAIQTLGLVGPQPNQVHRLSIDTDLWSKYRGTPSWNPITRIEEKETAPEPAWKQWIDDSSWIAELGTRR
jgi:cell division protein FtsB